MPDAAPVLILTDAPGSVAQAAIRDGLSEYNVSQAGYRDSRPLAVLVRDPETEQTIGGLIGRTSESLRKHGIGARVIRTAEEEAVRRGCSRAVLFTVTFQAPGFYERQGYQVLGRIECKPPGHTRICMTKKLGTSQ